MAKTFLSVVTSGVRRNQWSSSSNVSALSQVGLEEIWVSVRVRSIISRDKVCYDKGTVFLWPLLTHDDCGMWAPCVWWDDWTMNHGPDTVEAIHVNEWGPNQPIKSNQNQDPEHSSHSKLWWEYFWFLKQAAQKHILPAHWCRLST